MKRRKITLQNLAQDPMIISYIEKPELQFLLDSTLLKQIYSIQKQEPWIENIFIIAKKMKYSNSKNQNIL